MSLIISRNQLINSLNFFLFIEKQQVELYGSQSKSTDDYLLSHFLNHFRETEQRHVDNITKLIKDLGGHPSTSYEYAGILAGQGTKMAGSMFAQYTKVDNMLRLDLIGEQQAIKDYKKLINQVQDPKILSVLWEHLIDEELHAAWMKQRISKLQVKRKAMSKFDQSKKN